MKTHRLPRSLVLSESVTGRERWLGYLLGPAELCCSTQC